MLITHRSPPCIPMCYSCGCCGRNHERLVFILAIVKFCREEELMNRCPLCLSLLASTCLLRDHVSYSAEINIRQSHSLRYTYWSLWLRKYKTRLMDRSTWRFH
eukprot:Protomagalhaensia_sp_Gyna_25__2377@NODE_2314_length_1152_cov_4_537287_g1918_i0_p1_GENE_NODE_2314_length_1152_cov_4_537287_g1918_i0NODE_2314_length_1152_cov_4_537287_g1918_i0_p1_ORF_typecomplete_len103_score2_05Claudin_2/PF13903_6/0_077_NODE_2314_length_1152_cov_4_537287_g1918_i08221130